MSNKNRYFPAKAAAFLLALTLFSAPLVACSNTNSSQSKTSNKTNIKESTVMTESMNGVKPNKSTITSLSQINAKFSPTTWHGKEYVKIDEESLIQIIELAMKDAKEFYIKNGAPGLTIEKDGKSTKDPDKFYTSWMNKYHFLARAKRESGNFMINYLGEPVNELGYQAEGIMAIIPEFASETLDEYFKNIFKIETNFEDLQLMPNNIDIKNYQTSKQSRENLKQCVYNSVYTSICYDIYNAKCSGPNHKDFYVKYGGYDEEIRHKLIVSLYLFRREEVLNDLKSGKINQTYFNSSYVKDILKYQENYQNEYENAQQLN